MKVAKVTMRRTKMTSSRHLSLARAGEECALGGDGGVTGFCGYLNVETSDYASVSVFLMLSRLTT